MLHVRLAALLAVAGMASSALAQGARPVFTTLVRNSDTVPGATDATAQWANTGSFGAYQAPQIDSSNNVAFRGSLQTVGSGLGTEGFWYGGQWTGTNSTGTLSLFSRLNVGSYATGQGSVGFTPNTAYGGPYSGLTNYGFKWREHVSQRHRAHRRVAPERSRRLAGKRHL